MRKKANARDTEIITVQAPNILSRLKKAPVKSRIKFRRNFNILKDIFIDLFEPLAWELTDFLQNSLLRNFLRWLGQRLLIISTVVTGYFLARANVVYPARHIIIYTFAPVFLVICFTQPVWGMIIYLSFWLGMIHKAIWDFPSLFLGAPIILLVIVGWATGTFKGINEKIQYVDDTNNYNALALWVLAAIHSVTQYGNDYQSVIQASIMLIFFVLTHVIGSDKNKLNKILYAIAAIYGFYVYKVLRMALFFGLSTEHTVTAEIPGRMEDNNELAAALVMVLPLYYSLFLTAVKRWSKNLMMAFFILDIVAIVYTKSRGGYIATLIVFLMIMFKLILSGENKKRGAVFIIIFALIGYGCLFDKINSRVQDILNWDTDQSAHNRILSFVTGWNMMISHPLGGVGMGKAYKYFMTYCPDLIEVYNPLKGNTVSIVRPEKSLVIHNAYAQVLGEMGLPGIFLFMSFLLTAILNMVRLRKIAREKLESNPELENAIILSYGLQFGIIGFMITACFLSNFQAEIIYVLAACATSLWYVNIGKDRLVSNKIRNFVWIMIFVLFVYWLYMTAVYNLK